MWQVSNENYVIADERTTLNRGDLGVFAWSTSQRVGRKQYYINRYALRAEQAHQ